MGWIVRGAAAGFIVLCLVGGIAAFFGYRHYAALRAARVAELRKNAEDTKVTLIEGWSNKEFAVALEKAGLGSQDAFLAAAKKVPTDNPYVKVPSGQTLEGYLFPDTYRFAKNSTPEMVVQKLLDNFTSRVKGLGVDPTVRYTVPGYENLSLNGQKGLSFHQIITLASIIEQESGTSSGPGGVSERKMISGIFYNRLMAGQALESDATINYVTGKDLPAPVNADLQVNSPYNTYRYPGLPPGPICNPSLSSIEAALHPEPNQYYYFLHKQPSGEVVYSKTFEEHKKNKALYLK